MLLLLLLLLLQLLLLCLLPTPIVLALVLLLLLVLLLPHTGASSLGSQRGCDASEQLHTGMSNTAAGTLFPAQLCVHNRLCTGRSSH